MEKITIIGTGTMGHSIALAIAWADLPVTVYGLDDVEIENAIKGIESKANVLNENNVIDEGQVEKVIDRIRFTTDLEGAATDATFIIEAAPEILELKQDLFKKLEECCATDTIFASNSSSLLPTDMAKNLRHPERVLGTHFWNPAHLLPLVEIIKGEKTESAFIDRARELMVRIDKQPILVNKEVVGFVGNRLQFALFREAQYLYESGVASIEDIDTAVELSIGRRLGITGPFMTADLGGLDIFKAISDYTFPDMSNKKDAFDSINQLVEAGNLGEKSGKGYYEWNKSFSKEMKQEREEELICWLKK
ncbi:3-hydroxyacyl-CoA dehydrogenase family protein [Pseudogracilibacillus sp. SO30301A]|uniref:3-hydroxyacyl-CoA dehydrogenase family protein n=1 Tax=Pseudogracilibacillus sp. SO30301A TaxID=3098291 RepID=UPI00300DF4BB